MDLQNLSSRPAFGKLTNECVEGEVKDGLLFTPAIKARIAEFLGTAPASGSATCIFLITGNEHQLNHLKARKVSELPACLEQDFEICRSLWDSASLLVDLDIEYVNFDFPAEPYLHPHRAFALQEVVETTVEKQLLNFGIEPLHLLSGRGHHFIWRIRRDSRSFDQLKTLGHPTQSILSHYERTASPDGAEIDLEQLPPCARFILEHPNDLLRPSGMRRIVAVSLSLGWHPRHIAGLIQSKFERDFAWGEIWEGYDPATRAEFYTRVFAGLVQARYDDLVDFNCHSAREQCTCYVADCPNNLLRFRQSLLDRRKYERLACRPLHGLFFPTEHL